ncbi:DUF6507 family protein [Streptomyces griseochromogenes]|uniref:DUF6507 family protein n=1 Tax=Streptomyces griseochromogenes TaxID=68214 RepID=UPI00247927E5
MALSRVTLVGEHRRVDLVLPSQEPIGLLLPEVMRLLGDQVGARPQTRHLVAGDGSVLDPDDSLESAAVADGAVLRLVRIEEAASAAGRLTEQEFGPYVTAGLVGSALAQFANHWNRDLLYIAKRTAQSLNGAGQATACYVAGSLEQAANAQQAAAKEPKVDLPGKGEAGRHTGGR